MLADQRYRPPTAGRVATRREDEELAHLPRFAGVGVALAKHRQGQEMVKP
jgi:hypothetical protein